MNHTIISPHLDDAVLSLGQYMAATMREVEVVTVLAGFPAGGVSAYDKSCGFTDSIAAMRARRAEDEEACRTVGATVRHLDFPDRQYRIPRDKTALVAALAALWEVGRQVWCPLGIGHPDHALVADCARQACPEFGSLLIYEEFPYRTLWPEQVGPALDRWRQAGYTLEPAQVDQGARDLKAAAIGCYRSQYPDGADEPYLYVPERAWQATLT